MGIEVLARGVVRYDRSASSYPICLSLPATQVCHIWSARCNASQQDGFTRCFFGKVQSKLSVSANIRKMSASRVNPVFFLMSGQLSELRALIRVFVIRTRASAVLALNPA